MDLTVARSPLIVREGFLNIELDRFQGPLDLLLHLIRQQDLDIFEIPIAKITDQFLAAIQGIEAHQLEGAGEFLEMAATLIRIKAQMLLPRHEDDEDQDPRAELVRRLLEYEQIREIAIRLQTSEAERARRFGKGYVPARPRPPLADTPFETTWSDVFEAALRIETPEWIDRRHRVTPRSVAMEDKVLLIGQTLIEQTRIEFSKLLRGFEDKMHGVMTLLAGLEMSRRRELFLRQIAPFSELWLYRRNEDDEVPPVEGKAESLEEPEGFRGVRRRPSWMKPEEPEVEDPLIALLDADEPLPGPVAVLDADEPSPEPVAGPATEEDERP
jgi:segregation and condensation protein A